MRPSGAPFLGENLEIYEVNTWWNCWFLFLPEQQTVIPYFWGSTNSGKFPVDSETGGFFCWPQKSRNCDEKQVQVHSPWPYWRVQSQNHLRFVWKTMVWGEKNKNIPQWFNGEFHPMVQSLKNDQKKQTQANHKEIVSLISNIATSRPSWSPLTCLP